MGVDLDNHCNDHIALRALSDLPSHEQFKPFQEWTANMGTIDVMLGK